MLDSNINARFKHYSIIHAIKNAAEYNTHIFESIGQPVTAINKWKAHEQELVRILATHASMRVFIFASRYVCVRAHLYVRVFTLSESYKHMRKHSHKHTHILSLQIKDKLTAAKASSFKRNLKLHMSRACKLHIVRMRTTCVIN